MEYKFQDILAEFTSGSWISALSVLTTTKACLWAGIGTLLIKRDPNTPHQATTGRLSKMMMRGIEHLECLGSDYGVNIEDQGPKNRPVQEVVRKQKQSDIQFTNRLLPNLVQENASGLQVGNNYPLTGQIAHYNESLRYLNEEIVYQIDGTPDVQICVAVKIEVAKDVHGEYPDPLLAFFAASAEPDANAHTVHHGFLNFGVGSTCTQAGLGRYQVDISADPIADASMPAGRYFTLDLWEIRENLQLRLAKKNPCGSLSGLSHPSPTWITRCRNAVNDTTGSLGCVLPNDPLLNGREDLFVTMDSDM